MSKWPSCSAIALTATLCAASTAVAQTSDGSAAPAAASTPYAPPSAVPLAPGPTSATLTERAPIGAESHLPTDYYLLTPATLGQPITVTLRSAAFDSQLFLVDSDGRVLASDDNGAGGRDATLTFPYTPGPGQRYYLAVTTAAPGPTGGYYLERVDGGAPAAAAATPPTPEPTPAAPTPAAPTAAAPAQVPAAAPPTAPASAAPPPAAATPAPSPPAAAVPAPAASPPAAPASAASATPEPTPSTAATTAPTLIALGDRQAGSLDPGDATGHRPGPIDVYRFSTSAAGFVQIDLTSDAFDTYLQLFDDSGALLAEDDDSGRRTNSQIIAELAAGSYVVEVSSFDGTGAGAYAIHLQEAPPLTEPEDLTIGQHVDDRWTGRHPTDDSGHRVALYRLEHRGEARVTALLQPAGHGAHCALELVDHADHVVDRGVTVEDGCVVVSTLRAGEDYTLRAIGPGEHDTRYTLSTAAREANIRWVSASLGRDLHGSVELRSPYTDYNAPGAGFTLELTGGEAVSISVRDSDIDARLVVTDDSGSVLASTLQSHGAGDGSLAFTPPSTGWYRIIVTGRHHWFGDFTLRVDPR